MERRNFIRLISAGAGASIIAPQLVLATPAVQSMAGGVYYTKDAPGRWSSKVAGHLPNIEWEKLESGLTVKVVTGHEMKGHEHYIVKHILLDKNFGFLQERVFDPIKDMAAASTFTLTNYSGALYALSVCNKHDTWLNVVEI